MDSCIDFIAFEKEILDEEGIFSSKDKDDDPECVCEKCMYCGYEIVKGEEKAFVMSTGDTIHRSCWQDYAEDNFYELCHMLGND